MQFEDRSRYCGDSDEIVPVAVLLRQKILESGVSHRQLAKQMKTSKTQLLRILNEEYEDNLKLASVKKVSEALGYKVRIELVRDVDIQDPPIRLSDLRSFMAEFLQALESKSANANLVHQLVNIVSDENDSDDQVCEWGADNAFKAI
jgi:transcriptional regulator with XRE-family HTH domain